MPDPTPDRPKKSSPADSHGLPPSIPDFSSTPGTLPDQSHHFKEKPSDGGTADGVTIPEDTGFPANRSTPLKPVSNTPVSAATFIESSTNQPRVLSISTTPAVPALRVTGYEILAELGHGGMGVVYKARHLKLNRIVALKMVLGRNAHSRDLVRFLVEAELVAAINHPNVVQVHEVGEQDGLPFLALEYLEGGSLAERLRSCGKLDPRTAAELVTRIAQGVRAAHELGIVHRDLKPHNVLLDGTGEPKVTDFGIAKRSGADLTQTSTVMGTPAYMAPEQARGDAKLAGPAADVYALGVILYECLTGTVPFRGTDTWAVVRQVIDADPVPPRKRIAGIPLDLELICLKCLAKDPRDRYPGAAGLVDDLGRFLAGESVSVRPSSTIERIIKWGRRNPAIAGLMAALSAVLLLAFVSITALWIKAEQTATKERISSEEARQAEARAVEAQSASNASLAEATRQKENAKFQQAHLEFGRAVHWCDEGRVAEGLNSFVRVVELAEQVGEKNLARVARVNLAFWPRELPTVRKAFTHGNQPRAITFFPDGRRAVVAASRGGLFVWDTATDQKTLTFRPNLRFARGLVGLSLTFNYWAVAISPDGKTVVGGGSDGQIWVWDVESPEPRTAIVAAPDDVWAVGFAPDGTLWATDGGREIQRWDLGQKKVIQRIVTSTPGAIVQSMIVSSNGKRLFTGDRGGFIQEWNTEKSTRTGSWRADGWISALALSSDENALAATGTDGFVREIDLVAGKEIHRFDLSAAYGKGVAYAPNHPLLIASDGDGLVRAWHRTTGVPVGVPFRLSGEVLSPRFPPKSDEFVVSAGNVIYHCRLPGLPGQLLLPAKGSRVRGLDYSPSGDRLAAALEGRLDVFDTRKGERIGSYWGEPAFTIRYDPDRTSNRVIRGTRSGSDAIDLSTGRLEKLNTRGHVIRLGFAPDRSTLLTLDRSVLSSWKSGEFNRPSEFFQDPDKQVGLEMTCLDVHPDGREVMVTCAKKVVFLDSKTLRVSRPGFSVPDEILDAKYLPGGATILIGRRDSVAQILDAATGTAIALPMTHAGAVTAVAASPDGQVLLTGSRDGTARFWDTATGLRLGPPLRHAGPVTHVAYGPNGDHVATGTASGDVLLWEPPPSPLQGSLDKLQTAGSKTGE